MAEEKEVKKDAEPKKAKKSKGGKKGKLPVIIVLVAVLGGGGFFGLKMASGGKTEKAAQLKLGDNTHVLSLGEYMVNTTDGKTFLKASVMVHLAEGTHLFSEAGGHGEGAGVEAMAPYVDAIRAILANQTYTDLQRSDNVGRLKKEIAGAVNELYRKRNPGHKPAKAPTTDADNESWQSHEGPVLVVYLTEFVWET
ncbi:MAG: flagellar basal body-associated FliL family protein [Fimbriimonadaceae bacterium]